MCRRRTTQTACTWLDARWSALRGVMPADSACLAVAYRNRTGELLLGVYDVLRVAASDTSKLGIFERQKMLHERSYVIVVRD